MKYRQWLYVAAGLAAATGLAPLGCASQPKKVETEQRIFLPAAPAPPRYQYLMSFSDGKTFGKMATKTGFSDWVVGTEKEAVVSSQFDGPYGMEARQGKLYVCDVTGARVHVIDIPNKSYKQLESKKIASPVHVRIDTDGTKYICDTGTRMVLVFDAEDKFVKEIGDSTKCSPIDLIIGKDELYVADIAGATLQAWSKDGTILRTLARKGDGPDELRRPTNLALGTDGNIYVSDTGLQVIKIFDTKGNFLGEVGEPGGQAGQFARPKGVAVDPHGNIYVADSQWDVVQVFAADHKLLTVIGAPGPQAWAMGLPAGLEIDKTSLPYFKSYIDPDFDAEYLLFVVNQYKVRDKITVWAFGRSRKLTEKDYQIDYEAVRAGLEKRKAQQARDDAKKAEAEKAGATTRPK